MSAQLAWRASAASAVVLCAGLAGCSSAPFAVGRQTAVPVDPGIARGDFPVLCLSESGRVCIGAFEAASRSSPGRTAIRSFERDGSGATSVSFPDGYFALAILVERDVTVKVTSTVAFACSAPGAIMPNSNSCPRAADAASGARASARHSLFPSIMETRFELADTTRGRLYRSRNVRPKRKRGRARVEVPISGTARMP